MDRKNPFVHKKHKNRISFVEDKVTREMPSKRAAMLKKHSEKNLLRRPKKNPSIKSEDVGEKPAIHKFNKWQNLVYKVIERQRFAKATFGTKYCDEGNSVELEAVDYDELAIFQDDFVIKMNNNKNDRIRECLFREKTEILHRVDMALVTFGLEHPVDSDEVVEVIPPALKGLISAKVTTQRNKMLERKHLLKIIQQTMTDTFHKLTALKEVYKWIMSKKRTEKDCLMPFEKMKEVESDVLKIHKYILKSLDKFKHCSHNVITVGDDVLKFIKILTQPYKNVPRMPIIDEESLLEIPSMWQPSVDRTFVILKEALRWVQQTSMKSALFNASKQYEIIMKVCKIKFEQGEKAAELAIRNRKINEEISEKFKSKISYINHLHTLLEEANETRKKQELNLHQSKDMIQKQLVRVFRLRALQGRSSYAKLAKLLGRSLSVSEHGEKRENCMVEMGILYMECVDYKLQVDELNYQTYDIEKNLSKERRRIARMMERLNERGIPISPDQEEEKKEMESEKVPRVHLQGKAHKVKTVEKDISHEKTTESPSIILPEDSDITLRSVIPVGMSNFNIRSLAEQDRKDLGVDKQQDFGKTKQDFGKTEKQDFGETEKQDFGDTKQQDFGKTEKQDFCKTGTQDFGETGKQDFGEIKKQDFGKTEKQDFGKTGTQDFGETGKQDFGKTGTQDFGETGKQDFGEIEKQDFGKTEKQDFGKTGTQDFGETGKQDFGEIEKQDFGKTEKQDFGKTGTQDFGETGKQDFGEIEKQDFGKTEKQDFGKTGTQDFDETGKQDFGEIEKQDFGETKKQDFEKTGKVDLHEMGKEDKRPKVLEKGHFLFDFGIKGQVLARKQRAQAQLDQEETRMKPSEVDFRLMKRHFDRMSEATTICREDLLVILRREGFTKSVNKLKKSDSTEEKDIEPHALREITIACVKRIEHVALDLMNAVHSMLSGDKEEEQLTDLLMINQTQEDSTEHDLPSHPVIKKTHKDYQRIMVDKRVTLATAAYKEEERLADLLMINQTRKDSTDDPPSHPVIKMTHKDYQRIMEDKRVTLATAEVNYHMLNMRYKSLWKAYNEQRKAVNKLTKQVGYTDMKKQTSLISGFKLDNRPSAIEGGSFGAGICIGIGMKSKEPKEEYGDRVFTQGLMGTCFGEQNSVKTQKTQVQHGLPYKLTQKQSFSAHEQQRNLQLIGQEFKEKKLKEEVYRQSVSAHEQQRNLKLQSQTFKEKKLKEEYRQSFSVHEQQRNLQLLSQAFKEKKLKEEVYRVSKRLVVDDTQLVMKPLRAMLHEFVCKIRAMKHKIIADISEESPVNKEFRVLAYLDQVRKRLDCKVTTEQQEMIKLKTHKPETLLEIWSLIDDMLMSSGVKLKMPTPAVTSRQPPSKEYVVTKPVNIELQITGLGGNKINEPTWHKWKLTAPRTPPPKKRIAPKIPSYDMFPARTIGTSHKGV